jgi:nuclear migration protein JNM1
LKREIEELREGYGRRNAAQKNDGEVKEGQGDIGALSKMLDNINVTPVNGSTNGSSKLAKDLGTGIKANGPPQTLQGTANSATYTVTYAPTYQQSHALAKAADFDSRLAILEKVMGLNSTALSAASPTKVILPTLDTLQRQVLVISESTPTSIDGMIRRVRTLTQESERLEESRKAAKQAQDALRASGADVIPEEGEDSEQTAKINALYGTLSTIDSLAPLLPSLLDRLRSLRAIHADAATASESLERVEKKQTDMTTDINKWREGLEKVEEAMKQGETVTNGNIKVVEGWVKELEAKMENL